MAYEKIDNMAKLIYIAGPLFSQAERNFLVMMTDELSRAASLDPITDFFLPHRDAGDIGRSGTKSEIFYEDLKRLDEASIVIALLDGSDVDSGTAIEVGYAFAKGKKIFGLLTDLRAYSRREGETYMVNNMVWGACEEGQTIFSSLDKLAEALKLYLAALGR